MSDAKKQDELEGLVNLTVTKGELYLLLNDLRNLTINLHNAVSSISNGKLINVVQAAEKSRNDLIKFNERLNSLLGINGLTLTDASQFPIGGAMRTPAKLDTGKKPMVKWSSGPNLNIKIKDGKLVPSDRNEKGKGDIDESSSRSDAAPLFGGNNGDNQEG